MGKRKVQQDMTKLLELIQKMDGKEFIGFCKLLGVESIEVWYEKENGETTKDIEVAMKDREYLIKNREKSFEEVIEEILAVFGEMKLVRRAQILRTVRESMNYFNKHKEV